MELYYKNFDMGNMDMEITHMDLNIEPQSVYKIDYNRLGM